MIEKKLMVTACSLIVEKTKGEYQFPEIPIKIKTSYPSCNFRTFDSSLGLHRCGLHKKEGCLYQSKLGVNLKITEANK